VNTTLDLTIVRSPVGPLALFGEGDSLLGLTLDGRHDDAHPVTRHLARYLGAVTTRRVPDAAGAGSRLERYFAGDHAALDEQPVRLLGTEFQIDVWSALRRITPGTTASSATTNPPSLRRTVSRALEGSALIAWSTKPRAHGE